MSLQVEYLDNAYWENKDKTQLKCIRLKPVEGGKGGRKKDVLLLNKGDPEYDIVVSRWGVPHIDKNTQERADSKDKKDRENRAVHEQRKKSAELEQLFNAKLQTSEIPEIKNSTNKAMRSKIRRAKSVIEMQALAALLIGMELGYIEVKK
tara:strand:+ start:1152 stop:1601 length:450 start_codon:yes stop_codon:yes gene_type:complete